MTKAERKAAQEAEDRAYRAARERHAEAKRRVREVAVWLFGPDVGCGDGGCIFGHPSGMHTNGGCRCIPTHRDDVHEVGGVARMLSMIAHELAKPKVAEDERDGEPWQAHLLGPDGDFLDVESHEDLVAALAEGYEVVQ